MRETNLRRIAIAIAFIGTFIILIIGETAEIPQIQIKDITQNMINKEVKLLANTTKIKNTPTILIADLKDSTGETTMIAYPEEKVYLEKNQQIEVIGVIKEYKSKLEIEAKQIRII